MLEREAKREKNLESRAREIERQRDQLERDKAREAQEKKDGKDDKMEEILRKVDADCKLNRCCCGVLEKSLSLWLSFLYDGLFFRCRVGVGVFFSHP
jgi:hypothetical protein